MATTVSYNNFLSNKVNFLIDEKGSGKSKKINIGMNYNGKSFKIEVPNARMPWHVKSWNDDKSAAYSIPASALPPRGEKQSDEEYQQNCEIITKFFDELKAVNEKLIEFCHKNSTKIFGKKLSMELIQDRNNNFVKINEAGDYPDRISPKIQKVGVKLPDGNWEKTNKPDVKIYIQEKEDFVPKTYDTFDDLCEESKNWSSTKMIIRPRCYILAKGDFGISISSDTILAFPKSTKNQNPLDAFTKDDIVVSGVSSENTKNESEPIDSEAESESGSESESEEEK
jgi:hypothetical protein